MEEKVIDLESEMLRSSSVRKWISIVDSIDVTEGNDKRRVHADADGCEHENAGREREKRENARGDKGREGKRKSELMRGK